jgi:acetate---CoA ligase (ADP-forming)
MPKGERVAVITNAGGPAILAVDMIERKGLKLAELSEETKNKLKEIVHPEGSVNNPVDLLPGGNAETYKKAAELLINDENTDAVISIFVEPVMVKPLPVVDGINSITSEKPLLQVIMPLPEFWHYYKENSQYGKPLFRNPEDPAVVLSNMLKFNKVNFKVSRLNKLQNISGEDFSKGFLPVEEINRLSTMYKIPTAEGVTAVFTELNNIELDFPVVLKADAENVSHKSEMNGVVLNIKNKEELLRSAEEMRKNFSKSGIQLDNFLVQPFIKTRFELLVGGFRDPDFGPMIMFGTGGKYVEFYEDTAIRSAFLSEKDIEEMIMTTKIGKLLRGVRGENPADIKSLKEIIKSVSQMMIDCEFITECDLNPLILTPSDKYIAVDIRIKTK